MKLFITTIFVIGIASVAIAAAPKTAPKTAPKGTASSIYTTHILKIYQTQNLKHKIQENNLFIQENNKKIHATVHAFAKS